MSASPSDERHKALLAECERLEAHAGLADAMSKASEGRFIPLGIDGEPCSPDAYFADEFDSFREQARKAYFSVDDKDTRCHLIRARRRLDQHLVEVRDNDLTALRSEEHKAVAALSQQPWTTAAIIAGASVAVGYWQFQLAGAIGGAIVGYFLGHGVVASTRRSGEASLEEVRSRLRFAEKDQAVNRLWPETFNKLEELTGEIDADHDRISALAQVLAHERGA